jgi:MbtH protein
MKKFKRYWCAMICRQSSRARLDSILKPNTQLKAEFAMTTEQTETQYIVVINHEEQYSIWPDFKEIPLGWKDANFRGAKAACLEHINTVWTDMRPLSLRLKMNAAAV